MLGMDQGQRSNAVGFNTAYLPDGEGSRQGGGTYTGQATEPTVQDYENFFGPSARDIKTDLQRFKRHGRWHLPDVLQGPNPWLTDRVDGLITDATNSPFTTKILPYRFKEEVDGKIKWNVWSFDEGMASRVPYESAARTLTQSKRSFAGYMVRQGMAIVLEHNFMMTPKGRENFKNQLNQLIGSIQYTNDLDVHMALVLAPSYQKTMRERYYTSDKSPPQICREFADLFGMMQKNVNALDILIEEGKAILRTWGGPMPDFLLCNSKLTFQMTMTPEKTNYITQGIDGVKRLRQGPDLGSYRGLSIVHSRSFAMELGQHPRDVLRRRVRTAEYYRILPNKKNYNREFEFYNEERDTWFTLSFQDLLKCARYAGGSANAAKVDGVFHGLSSGAGQNGAAFTGAVERLFGLAGDRGGTLGARFEVPDTRMRSLGNLFTEVIDLANGAFPVRCQWQIKAEDVFPGDRKTSWYMRGLSANTSITIKPPVNNAVWEDFQARCDGSERLLQSLSVGPFTSSMLENIYNQLRGVSLPNPFDSTRSMVPPRTQGWYAAYSFFLEIIKRGGLPLANLEIDPFVPINDETQVYDLLYRESDNQDYTKQLLGLFPSAGSANHPFCLWPMETRLTPGVVRQFFDERSLAAVVGRTTLMTVDLLDLLLAEYEVRDQQKTGFDIFRQAISVPETSAQLYDMLASANFGGKAMRHIFQTQNTLTNFLTKALHDIKAKRIDARHGNGELLAARGVTTIPMFLTSMSHLFSFPQFYEKYIDSAIDGHLSLELLRTFAEDDTTVETREHPWFRNSRIFESFAPTALGTFRDKSGEIQKLVKILYDRVYEDPYFQVYSNIPLGTDPAYRTMSGIDYELRNIDGYRQNPPTAVTLDRMPKVVIDLQDFFHDSAGPAPAPPRENDLKRVEDVEIVIVRPNIEHNMLGVIMGLGGEQLGNTLWGQTELSVYDDSMHGLWGMSYKYHERAIVFNEKNLIRMWDIAYDGYNGGKDDTYVDWTQIEDDGAPHGPKAFQRATLDLSKNYRGPSMMVMAFVHDRHRMDEETRGTRYDKHFRRNWPSPIVFFDSYEGPSGSQERQVLPIDYDNVQTVDVEDFRVFNNDLYYEAYRDYRDMMPEFKTMHVTRKTAGQSSADAETGTDCLAFQGSMRIKEGGMMIQEVLGSGHHGPDYVGIASVRAGKGQKVAGQAPAPYRIV